MAAFMDLFDPSLTDEPVLEDLDELLSASALLENKTKGSQKKWPKWTK